MGSFTTPSAPNWCNNSSSFDLNKTSLKRLKAPSSICSIGVGLRQTQLGNLGGIKYDDEILNLCGAARANSAVYLGLASELKQMEPVKAAQDESVFDEMKDRFLKFKREQYLEKAEHFQSLANAQAPKFMVVACADSRVCPSYILGFQPGEAFIVRNVANLVPPFDSSIFETKAALEFSVNTLKVENILIVGHSCCGGIQALMSMEDDEDSKSSSFIRNWVIVGKNARLSTKAVASDLSLDQQCRHCEKESINRSLMNLLSYPWIQERVNEGTLSIHGGYYNFVDCTFEKWTLDHTGSNLNGAEGGCAYAIKNREFWS